MSLPLAERNRLRATHNQSRGQGGRPTRTYTAWVNMIQRCGNSNHKSYPRYGGRGIAVCERWGDSFEAFLEDMGESKDGMQIDRIDVDANYEPSNCRWVLPVENANNRANNKTLIFEGKEMTIAQWARELGIGPKTIAFRLKNGWTIEEALTMKVDHGNNRNRMVSV